MILWEPRQACSWDSQCSLGTETDTAYCIPTSFKTELRIISATPAWQAHLKNGAERAFFLRSVVAGANNHGDDIDGYKPNTPFKPSPSSVHSVLNLARKKREKKSVYEEAKRPSNQVLANDMIFQGWYKDVPDPYTPRRRPTRRTSRPALASKRFHPRLKIPKASPDPPAAVHPRRKEGCRYARRAGIRARTPAQSQSRKRRRVRGRISVESAGTAWRLALGAMSGIGVGERDRRTDGNAGGRSGVAVKKEDVREVRCVEAMGGCVVYVEAAQPRDACRSGRSPHAIRLGGRSARRAGSGGGAQGAEHRYLYM
ncbi:hypothetical protein B0H13DRAFT_2273193 [Mycena leptocephala]|nr:hypothetical protein B0H13DRAFT_2273193 [Mycena leptocephala]